MSDKFNELIELLIAEHEEKAQELFHDIVVERSRSIYESLIDEETVEEAEEEVAEDEAVEEAEETVDEAEEVEESDFDEELGGDAADDMISDIEADEEGLAVEAEDDEEELEDRVVDLEDALDELKAEFDRLMGDDEGEEGDMDMDMDMGDEEAEEEGDEEEEMESVELEAEEVEEASEEVVREYSEKANVSNVEEGDGASGPVAGKNDMGGNAVDPTGEESGGATPASTTQTDAADPKGATMSKA